MLTWLKLSHHDHSGQLRPHEHTSYLPLGILLVVVGVALTAYSVSAASPPPQEGSIGLTGMVPGDPPNTAPTITKPTNGQRFASSPVRVEGTCPLNTVVEIFKNDIFAGSTICGTDGKYVIDVDMLFGENTLIARAYDALNQPAPDSNAVNVFYDVLPPQAGPLTSFNFGGSQLMLNTDALYRGLFPEKEFAMPIDILGGVPPYAINIQWGDTNNKVVPRPDNNTFKATHTYQKPGTYQISIQATDSTGRVAFLGVAAIVNGQPSVIAAAENDGGDNVNQLLVLWPVYTSAIAIVISFWLGERREKHILSKRAPLVPLQS